MFGIGRWFKKTKVGTHFEKAKDQIEGMFDEHGFGEVFDLVKESLESLMQRAESTLVASGLSKWAWVRDQLIQRYPGAESYIGLLHKWATAYVESRKALGLWK